MKFKKLLSSLPVEKIGKVKIDVSDPKRFKEATAFTNWIISGIYQETKIKSEQLFDFPKFQKEIIFLVNARPRSHKFA